MRKRVRLIRLTFRRTLAQALLPVIMLYAVLPMVAAATYRPSDLSKSLSVLIYLAQALIPVCGILWPMAYLHPWVEGDSREALKACRGKGQTCLGEVVLLYLGYLILQVPVFMAFFAAYGFLWMEFVRLSAQCLFVLAAFYAFAQLSGSVTIGSLPVIAYLLLCVCFAGKPELAGFSILAPYVLADAGGLCSVYLPVAAASMALLLLGAGIERWMLTRFLRA